jgi:ATP-dependent protease ClpP protease subunit
MADWWKISRPAGDCTRVDLYDGIGMGDGPAEFLKAIHDVKTPKIDLRINSDGGDITTGIAILNAIKSHPADVTATIESLAASIASVIAMGADKIVMRPEAFMMIHNGNSIIRGDAAELRSAADGIEKMTDMIAGVYAERTKKPADEWKAAMGKETWIGADEAKACGLCDEISGSATTGQMGMNAMRAILKMDRVPQQIRQKVERMVAQLTSLETPMEPLKVYQKDGKNFVDINGVATEIQGATPPSATNQVVAEDPAKLQAKIDAAREAGKLEERTHSEMFNTITAAANITGDNLVEFRKQFYNRSEADLKFLASNAISARAQAVGEGAGAAGAGGETEEQKSFAKLKADAKAEFSNRRDIRRLFKCANDNPDSPEYKAAFARFLNVEIKNAADSKNPIREPSGDGDPVSRIMKNQNVLVNVDPVKTR